MLDILLVDDEPDIRSSLGDVLREEGHAVDVAADAEAAMARLNARRFHLVVSDVRLPTVDGLTLLRSIRRDYPDTEVLLMTAYGSIGDAVAAIKDDAIDYLQKPFDLKALLGTIGRIEQRRRARKRRPASGGASAGEDPSAAGAEGGAPADDGGGYPSLNEALEDYEKALIARTIREAGQRRTEAAKMLGISRKSLWQKLTKYGLQTRRARGSN
jgi:DNA-binding NtrC family response regulator